MARLRWRRRGYHLMLMQADSPVKPGDSVSRSMLKFADGSTLATDFLARPANAHR